MQIRKTDPYRPGQNELTLREQNSNCVVRAYTLISIDQRQRAGNRGIDSPGPDSSKIN